jgi:hypothetical protein
MRGFGTINKLNNPRLVVVVLILIIVINGFLFYRYQRSLPSGVSIGTVATTEYIPSEIETRAKALHRAGSRNIVTTSPYIDDSLSNDNPDAILLVERKSQSSAVVDAPPLGVWYDANRGNWAVFHQDLSPINRGEPFNINIVYEPGPFVFVHYNNNTVGDETYINHPSTNENPDAVLKVTPNYNPGGGDGILNNHPLRTHYDSESEKWVILNTDSELLPNGAAFNVAVSKGTTTNDPRRV